MMNALVMELIELLDVAEDRAFFLANARGHAIARFAICANVHVDA
jgi:hypothetical protein